MSDTTQLPLKVRDIPIVTNKELKKVIVASGLGNAVEWFDLSVYGFLTVVIGKAFFSNASDTVQFIVSLATFSIPFLFRPLGGAFFGHLGDRYGRKNILAFTIILMSCSTFFIGLIPSYDTIGVLAPILLILAKIMQGLSVGGEYSGAVVFVGEYSPDRKRGFLASWLDFGSISGFLLGALVVFLLERYLGTAALNDWGWRVAFLISLPLGVFGLILRHSLEESPTYENQSAEEDRDNTTAIGEIIKQNWVGIAICCCMVITTNTTYYMLLTYMPNYLSVNLHYDQSHGNLIIICVMAFMLFVQPLVGLLSDKIGRKPVLLFGSIAMFLLAFPAFSFIQHDNMFFTALGLTILALILCSFTGITAAVLPALFPTEVRFRMLAICFNVSVIIAGVTPPVSAWLVENTGSLYMPAVYLMIPAFLGAIAAISMTETANRPLKDSTPVASSRREAREVLQDHFDDIEDQVTQLEGKIAELKEERQNLIDRHPILK